MQQKRPHVLVIDGSPAVLDLFHDLLEGEGYQVSLCATELASLDFVKRIRPDLVVLDLVLSTGGAGQNLLKEMRNDPETDGIVILVCTSTVHLLEKARDLLAEDGLAVIQKPFDIDMLLETIARCLRFRRRVQPPVSANGHAPAAMLGAD